MGRPGISTNIYYCTLCSCALNMLFMSSQNLQKNLSFNLSQAFCGKGVLKCIFGKKNVKPISPDLQLILGFAQSFSQMELPALSKT